MFYKKYYFSYSTTKLPCLIQSVPYNLFMNLAYTLNLALCAKNVVC